MRVTDGGVSGVGQGRQELGGRLLVDTRGRLTLVEFLNPAGFAPPLHLHREDDELFYLVSGRATFRCDGHQLQASPGDVVFLPAGLPHTFLVSQDEPLHVLQVTTLGRVRGLRCRRRRAGPGAPPARAWTSRRSTPGQDRGRVRGGDPGSAADRLIGPGEWPARPARRQALAREYLAQPRRREGGQPAIRVLLTSREGAMRARSKAICHLKLLLVQQAAGFLLAEPGVRVISAAQIVCAWSHPGRLRSEAAFAAPAGVAPIPASSGQVCRHRRFSRDYERLCATGEALISIPMDRLMLRRLARTGT